VVRSFGQSDAARTSFTGYIYALYGCCDSELDEEVSCCATADGKIAYDHGKGMSDEGLDVQC